MASNIDWFHDAKWGVFAHYLGAPPSTAGGAELSAEAWNAQVDASDVPGLVEQLVSTGAGYFSYLGTTWCGGDRPRFGDDLAAAYTRYVTSKGGVVTWDVPILKSGLIPLSFVAQLQAIGRSMES